MLQHAAGADFGPMVSIGEGPNIFGQQKWGLQEFRAIKVHRVSDGKRRKQSSGVISSEKWRNESTLEEQAVVGSYPPLPKSLKICEASPNLL